MMSCREGNTQERENQFDQLDHALQDVEYSIGSCSNENQLKENLSDDHDRRQGDANEKSVLHSIMSQSPTVQLINFLIDVVRDDLNGPPEEYLDELGRTPLHLAVSAGCDISVIQRLLIGNRSVQIVDLYQRYPLHYACSSTLVADKTPSAEYNNMVSIITTLLWAHPRALSCQDFEGNTPLDVTKKICTDASVIQILDSYHRKMLSPSSKTPTSNTVRIAHQQKELSKHPSMKTMFPDNATGKRNPTHCKDSNKNKTSKIWKPPPSNFDLTDMTKKTVHNSNICEHNRVPYIKTDDIDDLFNCWSSLTQSSKKLDLDNINNKMELRPSISSNGDRTAETHELTSTPGLSLTSSHSSISSFCLQEAGKAVDDLIESDNRIGMTSDEEKSDFDQELDDSVRCLKDVVIPALYQGGVHHLMPRDTDKNSSFTDPIGHHIRHSQIQGNKAQESNKIMLFIVSVPSHVDDDDDDDCSSIGLLSAHMSYNIAQSKVKFGNHHHPAPDYERMEL